MALVDLINKYEGCNLKLYQDTVGKWTIGFGRNVSDFGISLPEALYMRSNDIARVQQEALNHYPWLKSLNQPRQDYICSMIHNMGIPRFNEFQKLQEALVNQDYVKASQEVMNSKWASQVGLRAQETAQALLIGKY